MNRTLTLAIVAAAAAATAIVIIITTTAHAQAQAINPAAAPAQAVSLGLGFDHGGVIELGYRRPLGWAPLAGGAAHARVQLPSSPGLGDGGLALGVSAGRRSRGGWGATAGLSAVARWVNGSLLDLGQGGVALTAGAGWFHPRLSAALELGWDHSLVTYAAPTAMYRRLVDADARGGLYGAGGGTLRGGVALGGVVSARVELSLQVGLVRSERLGAVPGMPFYALAGGAIRL